MRNFLKVASFVVLNLGCVSFSVADEQAVRQVIADYAAAFNDHHIDRISELWSADGILVDRTTGERITGRDAIVKDLRQVFRTHPNTRIFGSIDRVRFIKPDIARVSGSVRVSAPGNTTEEVTDFSALVIQQQTHWVIDTIEESQPAVPASPGEALADLNELIGRWVDESDSGQIINEFRFTDGGNFVTRTFHFVREGDVVRRGTQVIGWDPRSGEIRGWTFNTDGSFGDSVWQKADGKWLIKSTQTLADGRAASGTFVLKAVSDDEMTMELVGHEIEGEPQPAGVSVTLRRSAPEEAESGEASAADDGSDQ
ncbi:SgcJ/EcaC family oxidoreductase [Crateriforma conspicua]|uniref:SgcJ/EcaC family oxidoreductase n=1 Tax=Crateriforma conspicua TaxID=2527996 RepID=UPI0018CD7735|nr:SgcJ/EcaC family oxidoreductase [Crateriforma conspicua]